MRGSPLSARRRDVVLVLAAAVVAVTLRCVPVAPQVFAAGGPWLLESDPWYHARLAVYWAANFPHRLTFDPYLRFPTGGEVPVAPLLDLLVALPAWALRLDQSTTLALAAWLPPLLAGLCVVLVYALGRLVFDRRVGLLAAALLAVEPGAFLARSALGFADHHVLEVALAVAVLLLFGRAVRRPGDASAPGSGGLGGAVLAGVALGAYLLAWTGGALLVALIAAGTGLQILLDHHRGLASRDLARALPVACGVAGLLLVLWWRGYPRWELQLLALAGAAAGTAGLGWLAATLARYRAPRWLLPLAALLLAAVGAVALAMLAPELTRRVAADLRRFAPSGPALTVGEVRPLLRLGAETSWLPAWLQWRTTVVYGLAGMIALGVDVVRRRRPPAALLFLVWSLGMLLAALGQVRFSYYLSVALVVLAALVCDAVLRLGAQAASRSRWTAPYRWLAAAVVGLLVFYPAAAAAVATVGALAPPPVEWRLALDWLRAETPEPFGTANAFLGPFRRPPAGETFRYPPGSYGVLAWWDHGYWIVQRARRIPIANPTQGGAREAALFFSETDPARALEMLDRLGARYVVADRALAARVTGSVLALGYLPAIANWSGGDLERWVQHVTVSPGSGQPRSGVVFRADYYRSMAARASVLGMAARAPDGPLMLARFPRSDDGSGASGGLWPVRDYAQAVAAMARDPTLEIVGFDPARTPVPLAEVPGLVPVYGAPSADSGVVVHARRAARSRASPLVP